MSRTAVTIALALPLLAIALGALHAELRLARTRHFTFEITGYDPRDLLRGRYLEFRLQLAPLRRDGCAAAESCCACLTQSSDAELAGVERVRCSEAKQCDGWLAPETAARSFRYYVPEQQAAALEQKLFSAMVRRAAHARVTVDSDGHAEVRALVVDGQPIARHDPAQ